MKTFWNYGIGTGAVGANVLTSGYDHFPGDFAFLQSVFVDYYRVARISGNFSKSYVKVNTNTRDSNSRYTFKFNGALGNQVVEIPAASTGHFRDTTHSDEVVTTDQIGGLEGAFDVGTGILNVFGFGGVMDNGSDTDHTSWWGMVSGTSVASSTRYQAFCVNGASVSTLEAPWQHQFRRTTTLDHLSARCYSNSRTTDVVIKVRKNSVDGNGNITILAGVAGFTEDVTNSDSFADGDTGNYAFEFGASNQAFAVIVSIAATADAGMKTMGRDTILSYATGTYYAPYNWTSTTAVTQAAAQLLVPGAFRIKNARVLLYAITKTGNTIFTLQKNGVDTDISITIPNGSTVNQWYEDAVNTVDFADGDLINWKIDATAGTGTIGLAMGAMDYEDLTPSGGGSGSQLLLMGVG